MNRIKFRFIYSIYIYFLILRIDWLVKQNSRNIEWGPILNRMDRITWWNLYHNIIYHFNKYITTRILAFPDKTLGDKAIFVWKDNLSRRTWFCGEKLLFPTKLKIRLERLPFPTNLKIFPHKTIFVGKSYLSPQISRFVG